VTQLRRVHGAGLAEMVRLERTQELH